MECDKVENRTLETEWALTILNFFENHPALIPNTHFGEKELRKGGGRGGGGWSSRKVFDCFPNLLLSKDVNIGIK